MNPVDPAQIAGLSGPLRVAPMAAPPAAEIARQRAAMAPGGGDSISFSAAARRLSEARAVVAPRGAEAPAMPEAARSQAAAGALVGARVAGAVRFEEASAATPARPPAASGSFPFYRDPGQANAAATAVAGSRLDVTA